MLRLFLIFIFSVHVHSYASYKLETVVHTQEMPSESEEQDSFKISSEEIAEQSATSSGVDDILRSNPAANTARGPRSSSASIQVRGLDQNKIFVKIDGSRQNFQEGHSSFIALDTENLKSVQIEKSSSNITQTGSIGGGVNFVTKDANDLLKPRKNYGSEFVYRTNSINQEQFINAKAIQKNKVIESYLSLSSARANNSSLSDGSELENSSYDDIAGLYKAKVFNNYKFKLEYFQRKDDAPTNPSLNPPSELTSLQSDNITIKTSVGIGYRKNNLDIDLHRTQFSQEKVDRESNVATVKKITTTGMTVNKKLDSIKIGAEFFQDELDTFQNTNGNTFESDSLVLAYPKARSNNFMGYLSKNNQLAENLSLELGVRGDYYEQSPLETIVSEETSKKVSNVSRSKISKNIIIMTRPTEKLQVYAKYSEGFKAPSMIETYASGLHIPGDGFQSDNFFIPNPDLEPETSITHEIGTKYISTISGEDLVELELNLYETEAENYIRRDINFVFFSPGEIGTTRFINEDRVSLYGADISLKYSYDQVQLGLNYSKVRGEILKGNLLLEDLPADTYQFSAKYFLDQYGLKLGYEGELTEENNRVNTNTVQRTDPTPGYFVHNIFAQKDYEKMRIDFRVNNFTNQKYRRHAAFLFETGIEYRMGIKYKINTF